MYKEKNELLWRIIYTCDQSGKVLQQCYKTAEYLNKQRKLLRMIEDHEISLDVFEEEYGNSDVFLKIRDFGGVTEDELMEDTGLLADAVTRFAERC